MSSEPSFSGVTRWSVERTKKTVDEAASPKGTGARREMASASAHPALIDRQAKRRQVMGLLLIKCIRKADQGTAATEPCASLPGWMTSKGSS